MKTQLDVGTIVQVPLHDMDTTKADGKTLTVVVVDVVQKKRQILSNVSFGLQSRCFGHLVLSKLSDIRRGK